MRAFVALIISLWALSAAQVTFGQTTDELDTYLCKGGPTVPDSSARLTLFGKNNKKSITMRLRLKNKIFSRGTVSDLIS